VGRFERELEEWYLLAMSDMVEENVSQITTAIIE
jgi:hypothetical protein